VISAKQIGLIPLLLLDSAEAGAARGQDAEQSIDAVLARSRHIALDAIKQGKRYVRDGEGDGPVADIRRGIVFLSSLATAIDKTSKEAGL